MLKEWCMEASGRSFNHPVRAPYNKRFKSYAAEALPSFLPMIGELRSLLKITTGSAPLKRNTVMLLNSKHPS